MSKSVLVIDAPNSCVSCPLSFYNEYYHEYECRGCDGNWKPIENYKEQDYSCSKNTIPNWCPLSPLPERKDLTQCLSDNTTGLEKTIRYTYVQGYNECWDLIQEGNKNGTTIYHV